MPEEESFAVVLEDDDPTTLVGAAVMWGQIQSQLLGALIELLDAERSCPGRINPGGEERALEADYDWARVLTALLNEDMARRFKNLTDLSGFLLAQRNFRPRGGG